MGNNSAAGLIDGVLAYGIKSGYNFYYVPCVSPGQPKSGGLASGNCGGPINVDQVSANPINGVSNYYYVDISGVIRPNDSAPTGPNDAPNAGRSTGGTIGARQFTA